MKNKKVKFEDLEKGFVMYEVTLNYIKKIIITSAVQKAGRESDYFEYTYQNLVKYSDIKNAEVQEASDFWDQDDLIRRYHFTKHNVCYYFDLYSAAEEYKRINKILYDRAEKFYDDVVKAEIRRRK